MQCTPVFMAWEPRCPAAACLPCMMKLSPYTGASGSASDDINQAPPGRTISRLEARSPCQLLVAETQTSLPCCLCRVRVCSLHGPVPDIKCDFLINVCILAVSQQRHNKQGAFRGWFLTGWRCLDQLNDASSKAAGQIKSNRGMIARVDRCWTVKANRKCLLSCLAPAHFPWLQHCP